MDSSLIGTTNRASFDDALEKAQWAIDNIHLLEIYIKRYAEKSIRISIVERQSHQPRREIHIQTDPLAIPLALPIGDIIRNLRASLDYALCAIIRSKGQADDKVNFPIAKDKSNLLNAVNRNVRDKKLESLVPFFLNEIEAIKDGKGDSIWTLNQIDRASKHRALTILSQAAVAPIPDHSTPLGMTIVGSSYMLQPGHEKRIKIADDTFVDPDPFRRHEDHLKSALKITFGPKEILAGRSVLPSLFGFAADTMKAIVGLKEAYDRSYSE